MYAEVPNMCKGVKKRKADDKIKDGCKRVCKKDKPVSRKDLGAAAGGLYF